MANNMAFIHNAELSREHDGWASRLRDGHRRAQSGQVPCSGARRQGKVLDVVSATIHGDEVAVNVAVRSWRVNGNNDHEPIKIIDITEFQSARKTSQSP